MRLRKAHQRTLLHIRDIVSHYKWELNDRQTPGITWIELFILFDTDGHRTPDGEHVRDQKAKERAEARRKSKAGTKHHLTKMRQEDAVAKPLFDEEVKRFKCICRQIARRELDERPGQMFHIEKRGRIKRFSSMGSMGTNLG